MTDLFIKVFRKIPKHSYLLFGIFLFVFVFPMLRAFGKGGLLISISYTIMLLSVGAIIESKKKWMYLVILIAVVLQWVVHMFSYKEFPYLNYISFAFSVGTFIMATFLMIHQIIRSKKVDSKLIIETIVGYLLIGVIFTLINVLIISVDYEAISFATSKPNLTDIIYYSFITVTTIGFGDISPVSAVARSFAILFGLISQLYLTIIIAFIIGKFLNNKD